ncbi:hypothetical protein [Adhaeribacter aquaticus]|uniref:hypothetical protein n=1 Tax=Adhaeribacter aquaticus TaxID=299567 RepID=UPI00047B3291|nr:hypothetical protein [Adhaeribacter aquaticus]
MKVFRSRYGLGDIVYLITDELQLPRMVTGLKFYPGGYYYQLNCGTVNTEHYEIEVSESLNESLRLGIDPIKTNIN